MSKSVGPVTMCSAKSLIGDVAVQMVLSLHHRNFHFLFKWSYLSTINTFTFFSNDPVSPSSKLSMSIQKSCLSIIKTFTFFSNDPVSPSSRLSMSIQKSCLSIIKTFTFYSNGPISQSLILSLFFNWSCLCITETFIFYSNGPASPLSKFSLSKCSLVFSLFAWYPKILTFTLKKEMFAGF